MNWLDFLCLWVGYGVCALALLRVLIESVIATYALCGFAHLASMAIFVGGTAALAPSRTSDLSRIAVRSLLAATLACLMTGCVVGIFYTNKAILF